MSANVQTFEVAAGSIRLETGFTYDYLVYQNEEGQIVNAARLTGRGPFKPVAGAPYGIVQETSNDKLFARILFRQNGDVKFKELPLPIPGGVPLESGWLFTLKVRGTVQKPRLSLDPVCSEFIQIV